MDKRLDKRKILMLLDNNFVSDARVEKEIRSLSAAGAKITVACLSDVKLPEIEERVDCSVMRILGEGYNAPLRKTYARFLQRTSDQLLNQDFDTLHCHDFYMLSIGVAIKQKRPEIRLVYDAHEFLAGWPFYKNSTGLNKWKGMFVWRKLVQKERCEIAFADQVITITEAIADRFSKKSSSRPLVIGNYPETTTIESNPEYFRQMYGIDEHKRILVHSGTIYQNDRFLTQVFDLLAGRDDFALIFVGNRPRFDQIQAQVMANEQWKKCIFFHPYPKDQKATIQLLSNADAGWLYVQDQWEAHRIGFSNRFVEYLAAGIPVVASPQEFTRNTNETFECCTFYTADHFPSFCKALEELKAKYSELKSSAAIAGKMLNWESESNKLINNYIS